MERKTSAILTIGHSNHSPEVFLDLLKLHRVTALVDVRSAPYSRFNRQFNREPFAKALKDSGIRYVYLGRELGGRSGDRSCYEHGRIRYDRLARLPSFHDGLQRVMHGSETYCIALMCAEKEPLHCHRTLLVGHELDRRGYDVAHILSDGRLETHAVAMARLLAEFDLDAHDDLFRRERPRGELVEEAISLQAQRVGHAIEQIPDITGQRDR